MNKKEIDTYLEVGREKAICIDRALSDDYPGLIREVWIKKPSRAQVIYQSYGSDDDGLIINIEFESLDAVITSLEEFLDRNLDKWVNYSKSGYYPDAQINDSDISSSWDRIRQDLNGRTIKLPKRGLGYEIPSVYWASIANWAKEN